MSCLQFHTLQYLDMLPKLYGAEVDNMSFWPVIDWELEDKIIEINVVSDVVIAIKIIIIEEIMNVVNFYALQVWLEDN